jgi:lysophospholipase L1-like esterase
MKIKVLCVALMIGCLAGYAAEKKNRVQLDRYAAANSELTTPVYTVLLGNSITDAWPDIRPAFFKDNKLVGRGISGQTTYEFLQRFRADVVKLQPEIVVINGGTNDVAENSCSYDEEATLDNLKSMVDIAKANGIKVILTSVLPAAQFPWNKSITDSADKIIALNKRLKAYAASEEVPYVDYYPALVDTDGRTLQAKYSSDGVHPNADGYAVMEQLLLPVIKSR